jgi:hypothetical protein
MKNTLLLSLVLLAGCGAPEEEAFTMLRKEFPKASSISGPLPPNRASEFIGEFASRAIRAGDLIYIMSDAEKLPATSWSSVTKVETTAWRAADCLAIVRNCKLAAVYFNAAKKPNQSPEPMPLKQHDSS